METLSITSSIDNAITKDRNVDISNPQTDFNIAIESYSYTIEMELTASDLFSCFTADIINEEKLFTR